MLPIIDITPRNESVAASHKYRKALSRYLPPIAKEMPSDMYSD
jgi:hypothetical protein